MNTIQAQDMLVGKPIATALMLNSQSREEALMVRLQQIYLFTFKKLYISSHTTVRCTAQQAPDKDCSLWLEPLGIFKELQARCELEWRTLQSRILVSLAI